MTSRRAFLVGLTSALAAPAIIRTPGLLMPVRKLAEPTMDYLDLGNGAGLEYAPAVDLSEASLLEAMERVYWAPAMRATVERIAADIMRYGSTDFPAILPADAV